ncbi:MAG: hypothetical protein ACOYBE_00035 [Blautia sp.]
MKEIGGYLGLEEFHGREYYEDLHRLNLGRTALVCLLDALNCQKLYVPYLLCDSMTDMCRSHGISMEYYFQDETLTPVLEEAPAEGEWLLLVSYYGQLRDAKILEMKKRWKNIIVDHTHSFFQRPLHGVPTLYSCRKFFGLPDGAYLSADIRLPRDMEQDISYSRMSHILGRYEETASSHYQELHQAAASYYTSVPKAMSKLTRNLLRAIDYEDARKRRNENYETLEALLGDGNPISPHCKSRLAQGHPPKPFCQPDGPLAYPFYFPEGIELRKALAREKIYVPTYWNNVIQNVPKDTVEYECAANILALPCDHRYGKEEMAFIAESVRRLADL